LHNLLAAKNAREEALTLNTKKSRERKRKREREGGETRKRYP